MATMMLPLRDLLCLFLGHFIGDFLLQSNWMALNKGRSPLALWWHAFVYTTVVVVMMVPFFADLPARHLWAFWLITCWLHGATDAVTSRITSRLWFVSPGAGWCPVVYNERKRHWFFVAIGADQLIHAVTLLFTLSACLR